MFSLPTLFKAEAKTVIETVVQNDALEQSAREMQNLQRLVEDHIDGYWEWNVGSTTLFLSTSFQNWLGYQEYFLPNDVAIWDQLIFEVDRSRFHLQVEATIRSESGTVSPFEIRIRERSGQYKWAKCQLKCVAGHGDMGKTVLGSFIDITSYKESAQELSFKNKEMQRFAYVVSHDLQAPLRNLECLALLLDKEYRNSLDEEASFYLHQMVNSTERMKNLINGLLEFSRIDQVHELQTVDCEKLVIGIIEDLSSQIKETKAEIEMDFLPELQGFECQLRSLFQNLIDNALKFSAPNQNPEIEISCEEKSNEYIFSVTDKGRGISEENREKIFMMFKRCQSDQPGYGIGLAHCKKIIEMHGGRIWVDATFKNGSRFTFTIPRK